MRTSSSWIIGTVTGIVLARAFGPRLRRAIAKGAVGRAYGLAEEEDEGELRPSAEILRRRDRRRGLL